MRKRRTPYGGGLAATNEIYFKSVGANFNPELVCVTDTVVTVTFYVTACELLPLTSEKDFREIPPKEKAMSDVKGKVKDKIDDAAEATKKAVDKVVDKSKDAAHKAGEQLEKGGKRLQDA